MHLRVTDGIYFEVGFLIEQHPFLTNYLTPGEPCTPIGATGGAWNAYTGTSQGWQEVAVDLSAYVGKQVEVSITYVTDSGTGATGVFVDDTRLTVDAAITPEGFESGTLGAWVASGPPAGSPPATGEVAASEQLINLGAAITTSDSVLLGFGIERLEDPAAQVAVIGAIINDLLGG